MTVATETRLLAPNGVPFDFDPAIDTPLFGPSVLAMVGKFTACEVWRIFQPYAALQLRGYRGPAEWGWKDDPRTSDYWQRFDAVVLCRLSWFGVERRSARKWFDLVKGAGKRVWYECDDDLFSRFMVRQQKAGAAKELSVEELEAQRAEALWTLQQCDGVTVSTHRLAAVVRTFTDTPVVVVPNAIDAEWFSLVQQQFGQQQGGRPGGDGVTIGWAGGNRPDGDLREMAIAWGRIARRYPQVTFMLIGHQPWIVSEHVPEPRIKRVGWRSPAEYPVSLVGVDVACCPLEDKPFNRCKSPIKAWEAALSGSAVVASPTVYKHCIEEGENGLLAQDADDWEAHLSFLVEHADSRRELAATLKRDVLEKWSLRRNLWRWSAAWNRLATGEG